MSHAVDMADAVATFAHGYAWQRSRTWPYLAERCGPLWRLYDAERTRGDYRREEFVAVGDDPAEVDALAKATTRGRYAICAVHPGLTPITNLRDAYKALGYRLGATEPLMVHGLADLPTPPTPDGVTLTKVTTPDLAQRLAHATGESARRRPAYLEPDSPERQWVALAGEEPVGWLTSTLVPSGHTWCGNMYVPPQHRRRGIARAPLATMLADDRERGARGAVLLASHTGALLYPVVGYEQTGTLLAFTPRR
ncbi:MAG: GNAT family N-acetyltransferase [Armatimonadetes bacterium]|nr:GNAT family N-acetyltransferase [Armatimonadota bacterium]